MFCFVSILVSIQNVFIDFIKKKKFYVIRNDDADVCFLKIVFFLGGKYIVHSSWWWWWIDSSLNHQELAFFDQNSSIIFVAYFIGVKISLFVFVFVFHKSKSLFIVKTKWKWKSIPSIQNNILLYCELICSKQNKVKKTNFASSAILSSNLTNDIFFVILFKTQN